MGLVLLLGCSNGSKSGAEGASSPGNGTHTSPPDGGMPEVGSTGAGGAGADGTGAGGAGPGTTAADGGSPPPAVTVDCVGGPCTQPNLCVDLDFLFVACVPCGGVDQVCCAPFPPDQPFMGSCSPGLICASNPNFQSDPPTDLVPLVCQIPGSPPTADHGLNHERLMLFP